MEELIRDIMERLSETADGLVFGTHKAFIKKGVKKKKSVIEIAKGNSEKANGWVVLMAEAQRGLLGNELVLNDNPTTNTKTNCSLDLYLLDI